MKTFKLFKNRILKHFNSCSIAKFESYNIRTNGTTASNIWHICIDERTGTVGGGCGAGSIKQIVSQRIASDGPKNRCGAVVVSYTETTYMQKHFIY